MRLVYLNVASPDYPLNIKSALSPQFQSFSQYRCKTAKKSEEEIDFLRSNPKIWNVHSVLNVLHSLVDKSNINRQLEVYTSGGEIAGWGWCLCCLALIWLSSVSFVWGLNQTLSNWVSLLGRGSLNLTWKLLMIILEGLLLSLINKRCWKKAFLLWRTTSWFAIFFSLGDPESVAGEYGRHSLYKMLGYFSLVGLLRLHSLLGDYYQAIKVLENIELNKKVIRYVVNIPL